MAEDNEEEVDEDFDFLAEYDGENDEEVPDYMSGDEEDVEETAEDEE